MRILLLNTYRVVNAKGGTEKVFCDMANAMAEKGHEVFAVCLDENQGLPGFQLDERVIFLNAHQRNLPLSLQPLSIKLRSLRLRKLFKKPRAKPDGTKMFCSAFLNDARMCCFFANAIVKY